MKLNLHKFRKDFWKKRKIFFHQALILYNKMFVKLIQFKLKLIKKHWHKLI